MPVDKDEFRTALGRFASGVTVVTTRDKEGQPRGLTVSAFTSLSLEPPLVLICIGKSIALHQVLVEAGGFVVNVLSDKQESLSRRFASREPDKFAGIAYREGLENVPVLDDVLVALECRKQSAFDGGDHTILVGEVEATHVGEGKPLLYFRGGYAELTL